MRLMDSAAYKGIFLEGLLDMLAYCFYDDDFSLILLIMIYFNILLLQGALVTMFA